MRLNLDWSSWAALRILVRAQPQPVPGWLLRPRMDRRAGTEKFLTDMLTAGLILRVDKPIDDPPRNVKSSIRKSEVFRAWYLLTTRGRYAAEHGFYLVEKSYDDQAEQSPGPEPRSEKPPEAPAC